MSVTRQTNFVVMHLWIKVKKMLFLYGFLTTLLYPVYRSLILPYRLKNKKEDPQRCQEKFGITTAIRQDKKHVWFHAASVGESLSLLKLVERFSKEHPHWQIIITSGTVTSAQIIKNRFPKGVIHQYAPLDFTGPIDRFLQHWQPDLMVWVESELWPNLIQKSAKKNIPLVLLNMRLSRRSFKRWVTLKNTFLTLLNCFDLILTQTQELDQNLKSLGYDKSIFCGNLKYAADPPRVDQKDLQALKTALEKRERWVAASTHNREEEIVLKAHQHLLKKQKGACLILVVRHPHRCDFVAQLINKTGLTHLRYSQWKQDKRKINEDVFLVDEMGVMGLFYQFSHYVFVAGSLVETIGGHNILEPLRQQCVTLHGPYMSNFKEVVFEAQKALATLEVQNESDLSARLFDLIDDPKKTKDLLKNGADFLQKQTDVLDQTLMHLSPYINKDPPYERA